MFFIFFIYYFIPILLALLSAALIAIQSKVQDWLIFSLSASLINRTPLSIKILTTPGLKRLDIKKKDSCQIHLWPFEGHADARTFFSYFTVTVLFLIQVSYNGSIINQKNKKKTTTSIRLCTTWVTCTALLCSVGGLSKEHPWTEKAGWAFFFLDSVAISL